MATKQQDHSPSPVAKYLLIVLGALMIIASVVGVIFMQIGGHNHAAMKIGGPFSLQTAKGRRVSDKDFLGEPMMVFFGYTHCPDICPTTLSDLTSVFAQLPLQAKYQAVFITVDPERDTPDIISEYASSFDPHIIGLSGSREALQAAYAAYRVYVKKVPEDNGEYSIDHSSSVYLMGRDGMFVAPLKMDDPPEKIAAAIKAQL